MSTRRMTRVNELIRRELGEALFRLMHENAFDMAAVTITHVITSPNLRHARVLVSIRDHEKDRGSMLSLIRRHRVQMQDLINRNLGLKFTPKLAFELDTSIERGDRVLDLLSHMDGADDGFEPPPETDTPAGTEPSSDTDDDQEHA
ncbi:MAG: 30S ribosome-binding factor RbfA [Verrucomicrobia bacterium]|nr:30S ribosome-binding factor RbfA [Verrucomicrobiota bacterium]